MKKGNAKWITLNQYGKRCLKMWAFALSANDITTECKWYLEDKGILTDFTKEHFNDNKDRIEMMGKCLTDAGIETVKHYIPNYWKKAEA